MSVEINPNMPGMEEASRQLDALIAEESASATKPEAGTDGQSATVEQRAAPGCDENAQSLTETPTDTPAAAETPAAPAEQGKSQDQEATKGTEGAQDAKAAKEQSRYAKSQERLTRTWEAVNAEKATLASEKSRLETERAELARKQAEFQAIRKQAEAPAARPEDYLQASQNKRQLADHQRAEAARKEDAGEFAAAETLRKQAARADAIAEELADHAETLRRNPPKGFAEHAAAFEQQRKAWTIEAAKAHPDLSKDNSPLQQRVAGILNDLSRTDPELSAQPSVIYHATTLAALQLEQQALKTEAARVPALMKQVGELTAKVKELESMTTPGSSASVSRLGSSSPRDEEADLERMARDMVTLR
jgi:DNA repair exonuclease SbcCD ATPase subunit